VFPKDTKGGSREISSCWVISFEAIKAKSLLTLGVKMQQLEGRNMSEIDTAISTDGVKLFRNLFIHLKLNHEKGSSFELGATEVMP
jgi:hypothetical protein